MNEKARNEKKLPDLDSLLKSLEEEEIRMTGKTPLNNVQASSSGGSSRGGSGGQGRRSRGSRSRGVELDVVAEAEAEVEIVARQITRMLHAITAKRQDTSLIIARSQSQYQKTTTKAIKL